MSPGVDGVDETGSSPPVGAGPQGRRAWIAVALIPVAFVLAMVVGEGLVSALGYRGVDEPPWWVVGVVGGSMTLMILAPALAALVYGRRARREGYGPGLVTERIGIVMAVYVVLTSLAGVVRRLL